MEIITNAKRNKGKHKDCVTVRDFYKEFKKTDLGKKVDYKLFKNIISDHNKKYFYRIIELSDKLRLPHRLGHIYVEKYKTDLANLPKNRWPVDYQESKKEGFICYLTPDYGYKIKWDKSSAIVKNKIYYYFIPTRTNKRWLADALKNRKRDYFG